MRIYKRDGHVVQTQSGELAYRPDEACTGHYWNPKTVNLTTLVAHDVQSRNCGPLGRYNIPPSENHNQQQSCEERLAFSHLVVGCNNPDTLKLYASCPEKTTHST